MENMIKTIIQMDKQARELKDSAEQDKISAKEAVERRKVELYNHYEDSSKEIIEMTQSSADEEILAGKKSVDRNTSVLLNNLESKYREMNEIWNKKIVKEVIGE